MINLIAAVGKRGQLGLNGELPWRDPSDLRWFKERTMGGVVIVGHNTALSLPPLPGRILVTMDRYDLPQRLLTQVGNQHPEKDIWIAGGAKTYEKFLPFIDRFYISQINYDGPADVWFPQLPFQGRR